MRILFSNNFFYDRGGAEKVMFDTARLLEKKRHTVYFYSSRLSGNEPYRYERYFTSDIDFKSKSVIEGMRALSKVYYNFESNRKVKELMRAIGGVDIAHIHNVMYRIGVSILRGFRERGIPVVYHLHDYNLMCGAISLMADGRICEACGDFKFSSALKKRCKGGLTGGFIIFSTMFLYHRIMNIFKDVDVFISPSGFLREKYHGMGFKKNIAVLPNFLNAEDFEPCYTNDNSYIYFGRLSQEKGILTLLKVCRMLPAYKFRIAGTGPLEEYCRKYIADNNLKNVTLTGYLKGKELYDEIKRSKASIVPSEWYENNSRAIMESMALGKPVIASRIGGNPELVKHQENGYLFDPFSEDDLIDKIGLLEEEGKWVEMGKRGREMIERHYNPQIYYGKLMNIYEKAASGIK